MTDTLWKPNRPVTAIFFFASATGLLFIIITNLFTGSTSESALLLGLSTERLALVGGMLVIFSGLIFLGLQTARGKLFDFTPAETGEKPSKRTDFVLGLSLLALAVLWLVIWTPAERFDAYYYYFVRLYPFALWLTCFCAAGFILLLAQRCGIQVGQFKAFLREERVSFWFAAGTLIVFGFLAWAVALRVVNMSGLIEDFWYGAGVPILPLQVFFALGLSLAIVVLANRFPSAQKFIKEHWPDLVVFVAIWAIAAWVWSNEPVSPDFFITEPVAPNFELYPDYDARSFDIASQHALIGQDLSNGDFFDRPLYSALLVYLHILVGQNYVQVVALQSALYAIFPALAYLLGKRLHSRAAGIGLAALFALRGVNAIQVGSFINTAHPKQMMTDFPSAILLMMMSLLLIRWLQEPRKNWTDLVWAGGILGLATLLRPHPLIYLPILVALTLWVYRKIPRVSLAMSGLVLAAALAGILPWLLHNGQGKSVVDFYLTRVKEVIRTRYPSLPLPGDSALPPPNQVAAIDKPGLPFAGVHTPPPGKSVWQFGIDNFLNNLTTTVQILPSTLYIHDARETVRATENFWKPYWDGAMSPWAGILLLLNLALIALGLGAAWKRAHLSGLVPLMVMTAYYVMNALARTSGGRYLVPVDWVVIVYYFIGILVVVEGLGAFFRPNLFSQPASPDNQPAFLASNQPTWAKIFGVLLLLAAIGELVPLSGSFFERRYTPLSRKDLGVEVIKDAGSQLGISGPEFYRFMFTPEAVLAQGRILYPRDFDKDQGWQESVYTFYHPHPYPRTIFTLIGPNGETRAVFPSVQAASLPNTSDAVILGCSEKDYVQVWAVLLTKSNLLIKRTPFPETLTCPLPEPVCDNNHRCWDNKLKQWIKRF